MVSWCNILGASLLALGAAQSVTGHLLLHCPIARGDPRLPNYPHKDNDLNAPLNAPDNGGKLKGQFPCRFSEQGPITGKYVAGQDIPVGYMKGNSHKGGHCQWALSYDNGKNWVVLKTILDLCFLDAAKGGNENTEISWGYKVPLPKGAKNGRALFSWVWYNAEGNRELYMNCADVEISGGSDTGSLTGPELFVAQLDGKPKLPEWSHTDAKQDGKKYFYDRKVVTIPAGAKATPEGTVVGEPCNGKPGANQPPATIPWNRFRNDDQVSDTYDGSAFFVSTNAVCDPKKALPNTEANYPYVKGTASPATGGDQPGSTSPAPAAGDGTSDSGTPASGNGDSNSGDDSNPKPKKGGKKPKKGGNKKNHKKNTDNGDNGDGN